MKNYFKIQTPFGERKIGSEEPCFIIAEMSGNHNHNFKKAVEIIEAAAKAGADAVKIQTYTPDTMTIDCGNEWFMVKGKDQPDNWKGQKLYDLYKSAYTPWEWQADLKRSAEDLGLVFFSTPFDPSAVEFLEGIGVPCYKISSYEATDYVLLKSVAKTKKPVIMSVGFADKDEIEFALATLRENGSEHIILLHCVTAYSESPNLGEINLNTMRNLKETFGVEVGFSDNNAGVEIPVLAADTGAVAVEKHFIIDRAEGGPDARFSVEPDEFQNMIETIRRHERIKGKVNFGCQGEMERENTFFRRSLFVVEDVKKGERLTQRNVRSIRPSSGMPTKYYDEVIGKKATADIERGTPLSWELIQI